MAIHKPLLLLSSSGNTTSRIADRVVDVSNTSLTLSSSANQTADNANDKSKPPQGFDGPVPDGITDKIPERATDGSVTSSNDDRQAAVNDKLGLVDQASAIDALLGRGGDQGNGKDDRRSDLLSSFGPGQTGAMPGIDQGFGPSPDGAALADAAAAVSGNPMKAFEAASVGGPLGELAGSQAKDLSDFDKIDLIAQHQNSAWLKDPNARVSKSSDGRNAVSIWEGAKDVYVNGKFIGHIDKNGNVSYDGPKNPDPVREEDKQALDIDVNTLTGTILKQLQAAQAGKRTSQGGSGDATPVDDGGLGGVVQVGSIAQNQSSIDGRNLFGQPGGPAGEQNISGGSKGLDVFSGSNGAGVINPGPDGGTPQGDGRFADDPASAAGGRQTSPNLGGGSSGQAEDLLLTGTDRADTLRGLGGKDTLSGLAGDDILDGGAGRDQLTGGTGADRFRFSAGSGFGQTNADRITDFNRAQGDRIEISRQAFGLAAGTSVSVQSVNSDRALNQALATGHLFVHDQRDGSLLFNQNGTATGFGDGGVVASLGAGTALQASDLALIA